MTRALLSLLPVAEQVSLLIEAAQEAQAEGDRERAVALANEAIDASIARKDELPPLSEIRAEQRRRLLLRRGVAVARTTVSRRHCRRPRASRTRRCTAASRRGSPSSEGSEPDVLGGWSL